MAIYIIVLCQTRNNAGIITSKKPTTNEIKLTLKSEDYKNSKIAQKNINL